MKKKAVKIKKGVWFVKARGSYLPASWQAWLCYLGAILYLSVSYAYMIHVTENLGWILFQGFRDLLVVGIILTWIAKAKS